MKRTIITSKNINKVKEDYPDLVSSKMGLDAQIKTDKYFERLVKLIPSEVIGLYLTVESFASTSNVSLIHWIVFLICFFGTYFYLRQVGGVKNVKQLSMSMAAFVVWAYAIGGPFTIMGLYDPMVAGILVPCFTFFTNLIKP